VNDEKRDDKEDKKPEDEEGEKLAEGTLISHLLELRDRIIRAMVGVGIALIPCVFYANQIFTYVSKPLQAQLPQGSKMIAIGVWSPFTTPFKLSFFVALGLAMPWVIYQAWAFVAPGLYRHEKRFAVPLLFSAILLFYVGMAFSYFVVFRVVFQFFVSQTPAGVDMMPDINQYLDFVLMMFLAFGFAFEVPVAVVLLVVMELVKLETLQKNRKYVLLGCFIVSAFLTPPDMLSQASLAVPMFILYEGGILMARVLMRMKREEERKVSET
jgi:sec-independent protein translocase protein TatC